MMAPYAPYPVAVPHYGAPPAPGYAAAPPATTYAAPATPYPVPSWAGRPTRGTGGLY